MMSESYRDLTFCDPNPIKRCLQTERLRRAVKLAERVSSPHTILDFGAGNGELCKFLRAGWPQARILCYEPTPQLLREASENLHRVDGVELLSSVEALEPAGVDLIFCLEVFEHLPQREMDNALAQMKRLLAQDGQIVVGAPVETGLPALYKGIFRMARRRGEFDATWANVLRCVAGWPPIRTPGEIAPGRRYYFSHAGFDHRSLVARLRSDFMVEDIEAPPIPFLGTAINPEVYFRVRTKAESNSE